MSPATIRQAVLPAIATVIVGWAPALAQTRDPIGSGDRGARLRVTLVSSVIDGILVAVDGGQLTIRPRSGEAEVAVPFAAVTKLERATGRRSRARNAWLGALAGFAIGATVGAMSSPNCEPTGFGPCGAGYAAAAGAILGGGAGAVTGALIPPATRWTAIALP